jgi:F5/8 type C domain-containing protein
MMTNTPVPWSAHILGHDTPVNLATGQVVTVNLRVKFACSSNRVYGLRVPVHASYKWFDGSSAVQPEGRHTIIPAIAFNQEFNVNATFAAPRKPGKYKMHWEFTLQEETGLTPSATSQFGIPVSITPLPNEINNWRVETNLNVQELSNALDGDANTAWDSCVPQARGHWFRLNLSKPRLLDGMQFLSPGNGFPRGFTLCVSGDGNDWSELARVPSNNVYDLNVAFAPQFVQYAQIDLLAASQTSWKISKILVHPAVEWHVTASDNQVSASYAIDNRSDTGWSTESRQEPGMWFQMDLGREEVLSGLRLVAPGHSNPLAFRIAAWDSSASRWQMVHEQYDNHSPVDVQFEPARTQFINVQLIEPSDQSWAITHAHVYREMKDWLGP